METVTKKIWASELSIQHWWERKHGLPIKIGL